MMKSKRQKARVLRQILLLMTAQALAITSMIWGGSWSVEAQESPAMTRQLITATAPCQNTGADQSQQPRVRASKKQPASVRLLDFSIGKPWG